MSTVIVAVGIWAALIVAFIGVLAVDAGRQCRDGRHQWLWELGRWRCARCGRVDDQASGVTR